MRGFVHAVPRCTPPAAAVVFSETAVAVPVFQVEGLDERYISGCPAYTPRWFDRQAHHTVSYCWADEEARHRHNPLRLTALPRLLCQLCYAYPVALLVDADREQLAAAVIAASVPVLLQADGVGVPAAVAVVSCSYVRAPFFQRWQPLRCLVYSTVSEVVVLSVHDRRSFWPPGRSRASAPGASSCMRTARSPLCWRWSGVAIQSVTSSAG